MTGTAHPQYVTGNARDGSLCHYAHRIGIYSAIGTFIKFDYVPLCTHKRLGGVYGQSTMDTIPLGRGLCPRCAHLGPDPVASPGHPNHQGLP